MKVGDMVIHIGANPRKKFRPRLVVDFSKRNSFDVVADLNYDREIIIFPDGKYDWKDQWKVFDACEGLRQ